MLHFCPVRSTRRGFLATLLASLATLFLPAHTRAAGRVTPRRRPGNKTRWIGHY